MWNRGVNAFFGLQRNRSPDTGDPTADRLGKTEEVSRKLCLIGVAMGSGRVQNSQAAICHNYW